MENANVMGINSYIDGLPFGKKDPFIMEVAEAIGQSTSSVRRKIRNGGWRKTEIPVILKLIASKL